MSNRATALERLLKARIEKDGPIGLDVYMAEALMHPEHGYYSRRDPFGLAGDFTTAPEMSQIFGELLGLWLADRWEALGRPRPVCLVELGPGRGTLMADALRAMKVVPDLRAAIDLHLIEASPSLRGKQAAKLKATWHETIDTVPAGFTLLIANEFFDALPIHQFVRGTRGWGERRIGLGDDGGLAFCIGACSPALAHIPESLREAAPGSVVEVSPASLAAMEGIARRLAHHGGAALIVDYGYNEDAVGDSLQAVRRHQRVDVLHRPGDCDITAHVNFASLVRVARAQGIETMGPFPQGAFLEAHGIRLRAAMLAAKASARRRRDIEAAVRRLIAPDMMGELFRVLALSARP